MDMGNDRDIREVDSGIEKVEKERPKKRSKRNKQDD
jgi:hypothetical protein